MLEIFLVSPGSRNLEFQAHPTGQPPVPGGAALGWSGAWVEQRFSAAYWLNQTEGLSPRGTYVDSLPRQDRKRDLFHYRFYMAEDELVSNSPHARLFFQTLFHYRNGGNYLLHEFVLMPNHFHLLITPVVSLEKSIQLVKGGFSFRAKKQLGYTGEVWESSYFDRRVRDSGEYQRMRHYIHQNPVQKRLAGSAERYPYSSAASGFCLDEVPQRLKPQQAVAV